MKKLYFFLCKSICLLLMTQVAFAADIYVKADASGANNGTSWVNAYTDLSTAIAAAASGDNIYVARGIYFPSLSDVDKSFNITTDIHIYGSFAGNETVNASAIANRDFITNASILSGDINGDDIELTNHDDNIHLIVSVNNASPTINGFIIQGANGTYGGGIYLDGGAGTYENLVIQFNKVSAQGAGIYTVNSSDASFSTVVIRNNYAGSYGGGISTRNSSITLNRSLVVNNEAKNGGGISNYTEPGSAEAGATIVNTTISNNHAFDNGVDDVAGGIYCWVYNNNLTLTNVIVYGNTHALYASGNAQISYFDTGANKYAAIQYCLIGTSGGSASWDSKLGIDNGNNIDSDPLFADPSVDDYRLQDGSPAIGAGNSTDGNNIGVHQGAGLPQPSLSITSGSTSLDFDTVTTGQQSASMSFTFSASNLSDDIILTAPDHFGISLANDDNPLSSVTVTPTAGSITNQAVYVWFTPTADGIYADSINASSLLLNDSILQLKGIAMPEASIIIDPLSLDFGSVLENTDSEILSYTVEGSNLSDDITITSPNAVIKLSLDADDFSSATTELTLLQTGGTISATTIYVLFQPISGADYSGSIEHNTANSDGVSVSVSAEGLTTPHIGSCCTMNFEDTPIMEKSAVLSYSITGTNLLDTLFVIAPPEFSVSKTNNDFPERENIIFFLPDASGNVNTDVYVQFQPIKGGSHYFYIKHASQYADTNSRFATGTGITPPRLYIKQDANGLNNGMDWENAYTSLHEATEDAQEFDTLFVAAGTYCPGEGNYYRTIGNGVIYGGLSGTEENIDSTVLANRDFNANPTILTGDVLGNDTPDFGNYDDNITNLFKGYLSEGITTTIDGFTFTHCLNGAISTPEQSLVLRNLIIEKNLSNNRNNTAGIYMRGSIAGKIEDVIVRDNYSTAQNSGTGISLYDCPSVELNRVFIENNNAIDLNASGTGLYSRESVVIMSNSVVNGNRSGQGSVFAYDSDITIYNTTITDNFGTLTGGIRSFVDSDVKLINTILWNNFTQGDRTTPIDTGLMGNVTSSYSIIQGSASSAWNTNYGADGGNNLDADPLLVNASMGDVRLQTGSPAIGTGNPDYGNNIGYYQGEGVIAPVLSISKNTIAFDNTTVGSNSSESSFTVSGSNLESDLSITAPEGFELTLSSGDYSGTTSSVELPVNAGSLLESTVYVRFSPSAETTYSDNIEFYTGSTLMARLSVSGEGVSTGGGEFQFEISNRSIDFGNVSLNEYSSVMSYTITGSNLEGNVSISASSNLEISFNSEEFDGETRDLELFPVDGQLSETIYVRTFGASVGELIGSIENFYGEINKPVNVTANVTDNISPNSISHYNNTDLGVRLYPNPVGSNLQLDMTSMPAGKRNHIMIHQLNGQLIIEQWVVSNSLIGIDISDIENGYYLLTVDYDGNKQIIPFIKK